MRSSEAGERMKQHQNNVNELGESYSSNADENSLHQLHREEGSLKSNSAIIRTIIEGMFARKDVALDIEFDETNITRPLSELGMDSLKYIVLILAIEEQFYIQFEDSFHANYRAFSLNSLVLEVVKRSTKE
jgi:acyl carrier protein